MAEEEAEEVAEDRATARQWQLQLFRSRSEDLNYVTAGYSKTHANYFAGREGLLMYQSLSPR